MALEWCYFTEIEIRRRLIVGVNGGVYMSSMRSEVCLALVVSIASCLGAQAADVNMPLKAPMTAPSGFNWNGFYVGGHAGLARVDRHTDNFDSTGAFTGSGTNSGGGVFGGAQGGYNWIVAPNWLFGLEIDGSFVHAKGSNSACSTNAAGFTTCVTGDSKIDAFGTARGRLGYIWGSNVLIYGTGGWAWDSGSANRTIDCTTAGLGGRPVGVCPGAGSGSAIMGRTSTASTFGSGWAAGGGIEWAFAPNMTLKVEYLHMQIDLAHDFDFGASFPRFAHHTLTNQSWDTVRVGFNYLFQPGH